LREKEGGWSIYDRRFGQFRNVGKIQSRSKLVCRTGSELSIREEEGRERKMEAYLGQEIAT
jgi:hypothetical protein